MKRKYILVGIAIVIIAIPAIINFLIIEDSLNDFLYYMF